MLEKYVNRFPAEKGCASFSGEDMKLWKEVYFPKLVQTDILLDGKFFCGTSSGNCGIGTDGYFTGYEFSSLFIVPTRRFMNWKRLHK